QFRHKPIHSSGSFFSRVRKGDEMTKAKPFKTQVFVLAIAVALLYTPNLKAQTCQQQCATNVFQVCINQLNVDYDSCRSNADANKDACHATVDNEELECRWYQCGGSVYYVDCIQQCDSVWMYWSEQCDNYYDQNISGCNSLYADGEDLCFDAYN